MRQTPQRPAPHRIPGWPRSAPTCAACCAPNWTSAYNPSRACLPPCAPIDPDTMTRNLVALVIFLAGLTVVGWVGAGYVGSNTLAQAVTGLIGVVYLAGALELRRYQLGTAGLARATASLSTPPARLDDWLAQVPAGLRHIAQLRVEGQRTAFPGPALAPYLAGMLVLLGMLGTLRGAGAALEGAGALHAIRSSLAAPVHGLGFAFGTSVAGVASSAALGLLAALTRRERLRAVQQLDAASATTLREYSQS